MVSEIVKDDIHKAKIIKIEPGMLFGIAEIMFDQGKDIILTVTGNSMYPFLRNNIDSVEMHRAIISDIKVADIVLVKRNNGAYVLHRVFKKEGANFYMIGDAQDNIDGPYDRTNLIGKVTAIIRKGKKIPCSSLMLRFLVRTWMLMRPLRLKVIRVYSMIRNRNR